MGAVGADAPIKIVLAKKYTVIAPIEIRADKCIVPGMWHGLCPHDVKYLPPPLHRYNTQNSLHQYCNVGGRGDEVAVDGARALVMI